MATKKKALQAAAGAAGGGAELLAIEDVFSTYLYTGTGSALTITNGIDLAGEGGMVWVKPRSFAGAHVVVDTERGADQILVPNTTLANTDYTSQNGITAFNSDGFSLGSDTSGVVNYSAATFASWTWRKAPRFFDVVTYTGTGANRTVAHNLGVEPGCIIIKETTAARSWYVYHRSTGNTQYLNLNLTSAAATASTAFNNTSPTDTEFTVGTINGINNSGATYVAYLFAHDPLGPSGDGSDGLIACGSFNSGGSAAYVDVDLGWEPQWLMFKASSTATSWYMVDTMRGIATGGNDPVLQANASYDESLFSGDYIDVTSKGFRLTPTGWNSLIGPNADLIYIAIRRGPMRAPESGTEVFAVDVDGSTNNHYTSGFPVDIGIYKSKLNAYSWSWSDRLRGSYSLKSDSTAAESGNSLAVFDNMTGWADSAALTSEYPSWMFRRAPGFFDAVAYSGDGVAGRTVPHNLGVAPELIIHKCRNSSSFNWYVYSANLGVDYRLVLDTTSAAQSGYGTLAWNNTSPTADEITLGSWSNINGSGNTYIAYLFATLPGVSKVGSYTGTGAQVDVDCGFTTGARFVLIKRTDNVGDWLVVDTARGIVSGNDPFLSLNTTAVENTINDVIDPYSAGFSVVSTFPYWNASGGTYIFLAIA